MDNVELPKSSVNGHGKPGDPGVNIAAALLTGLGLVALAVQLLISFGAFDHTPDDATKRQFAWRAATGENDGPDVRMMGWTGDGRYINRRGTPGSLTLEEPIVCDRIDTHRLVCGARFRMRDGGALLQQFAANWEQKPLERQHRWHMSLFTDPHKLREWRWIRR